MSIAGIAAATGKDPWEVLYDDIAAGTLLLGAFLNYGEGSSRRAARDDRA